MMRLTSNSDLNQFSHRINRIFLDFNIQPQSIYFMKNILVSTDFSTSSNNASKYAVALAQAINAQVTIVNVVAPPMIVGDSLLAPILITQAEIIEKNKELMNAEVDALSKEFSIKIQGFVIEGFAKDKIQEFAKVKQSELIVMGMKGKGKSNSLFGSTTTSIIKESNIPVLVIPEEAHFESINTITLASDFDSTIGIDSYSILFILTESFHSKINILNVQKEESSLNAGEASGKMEISRVFSKHNYQFHNIKEDKVEDGINKFLKNNPTNILAMVAHKHSFFERMFGKVYTKAMSYQTEIPLLVLQNK
jgi:nucleotide-binding universal stress UspA family protein